MVYCQQEKCLEPALARFTTSAMCISFCSIFKGIYDDSAKLCKLFLP